jgi:hypothetical protein
LDVISISNWSNYLSAMAGASATLTGLVFVAVSINLSNVLSVPGLTGRAAESMTQLFGVLVLSTITLVPRQSAIALGTEILILASALWFFQTVLQIRYMRSHTGHPRVVRGIVLASAGIYFFSRLGRRKRLGITCGDPAIASHRRFDKPSSIDPCPFGLLTSPANLSLYWRLDKGA